MDSDDQNFNSSSKIKCDIDNNFIEDAFKTDDDDHNCLDGNGNRLNNDKEESNECNCMRNSSDNHLDEKIMRKLQAQAMSISDDDYGEYCQLNHKWKIIEICMRRI